MRVPEKIKAPRRKKLRVDRIAPRECATGTRIAVRFNNKFQLIINMWEAASRRARRCISRTSFHYIAKDEPLICEKSGF